MHIKTTLTFCLIPVVKVVIKKDHQINDGKDTATEKPAQKLN